MKEMIRQPEEDARRAATVAAAVEVFLRYGYARTTMAELAVAASLSRPTLYEVFRGKDELFAAVINHLNEQTIRQYRIALPELKTLRAKLHHFCGDWSSHGLKLIERHPDAKDLFDLKFPAVRQMYEDFIVFLTEVVASAQSAKRSQTQAIVRNLVFSLRGLKEAASDVTHMEMLVRLQVDIFLATLVPKD